MVSKKTLNTLIASAVALTVAGAASTAVAAGHSSAKEKCFGVVKAGNNDCGSASKSHACAGHATVDASGDEWLTLPKGVCEKLAGGSVAPITAKDMNHGHDDTMDKAKDAMMDKAKDAMH